MRTVRWTMQLVVLLALAVGIGAPASTSANANALLYASGVDSSGFAVVQAYDVSAPSKAPVSVLKGLTSFATGMAVDGSGNLYVSQTDPNQPVVIFKPGKTMPYMTLTNPLASQNVTTNPMPVASDVAVGADGTVYALLSCSFFGDCTGIGNTGVLVYKSGKAKPSEYLTYDQQIASAAPPTPQCALTAVTVDAKGNVYVGCNGVATAGLNGQLGVGRVIEFPAGSTHGVDMGLVVAAEWPFLTKSGAPVDPSFVGAIDDIQFDAGGNLAVLIGIGSGGYGNAVLVYPPGTPRPSHVIGLNPITANGNYQGSRIRIRFDATSTHLFVNSLSGSVGEVDEYTYPAGKLVAKFQNHQLGPDAIALSPASPL